MIDLERLIALMRIFLIFLKSVLVFFIMPIKNAKLDKWGNLRHRWCEVEFLQFPKLIAGIAVMNPQTKQIVQINRDGALDRFEVWVPKHNPVTFPY